MNSIKKVSLLGVMASLLFAFSVMAAEIPPELVSLAKDLGCQTKVECAQKFNANLGQGIALAQKYNIYTPEQQKVAVSFKTEVLEKLSGVSQDNFEEEILVLANKILKEKPALAKTMGVTKQGVSAAETIINTVKSAGVDIRTCQKSPEDLSREELIACVKAGNELSNKGTAVENYIPKENVRATDVGKMLDLEKSLLAGEYSGLGKISSEQAGQVCLKSGSESIKDCDLIAQKFFGDEGVKRLQEARKKTSSINESQEEGLNKMELTLPNGQKLIGKETIKSACDSAFNTKNLDLARACGNFAVKNGYATQAEMASGLKLLESFSQKSEGVNFENCRFDPQSCRKFLPEESLSQFDSQSKIFQIMSDSIGFDPARCENSNDPEIGKKCIEGAKAALSKVEEIAKKSPEARRIVDEIKSHINEGERMGKKLDEFNQDSNRGKMTGPGQCRGPEECFKYCSQPANSAECISFGAKSQIFDKNTAEKFNMINDKFKDVDYSKPIAEPFPVCKAIMPTQCPEGQMRQSIRDNDGCMTYGACVTMENYKPIDNKPVEKKEIQNMNSCDFSTQYWKPSTNKCMPRTNCSDTTNSEYNSSECQGVRSMSSPTVTSGCGSLTTQPSCQAVSGCGWANGACGGNTTTSNPPTICTAGQYWNGSACVANNTGNTTSDMIAGCTRAGGTWSTSSNYCQMPNSNNTGGTGTGSGSSCTSNQYWNGSACVSSSVSPDMSAMCASGGGSWNGTTCVMPNSSMYNAPSSSSYPSPSGSYMPSGGSMPSGSYTPPSSSSYTPPPSYPMSNPSTYTPPPAMPASPPPPPPPSSPSAMLLCTKSGGAWTGVACNSAESIAYQKAYYSYFQNKSDSSLAQVFRPLINLFK